MRVAPPTNDRFLKQPTEHALKMGQFCIIYCEDAASRSQFVGTAERLFGSICGLQTPWRKSFGCTEILLFPRANGTSPTVYEADDKRSSLMGIGTYFHGGKGGGPALKSLASALDADKLNWD